MISKVSIRNFKSLRDVHVDLERFTVFVGPNASGKTSILQALDLLCRAFQPVVQTEYEGNDPTPNITHVRNEDVEAELAQARSRGAKEAVEVAAYAGGVWCRYRTRSKATSPGPAQVGQAILSGGVLDVGPDPDLETWRAWNLNDTQPNPLPSSALLRLEPSKLMRPRPAESDPTIITADGTGLHSALANIALSDPETWQKLQDQLRQIVPTVRRLRHTMKGANNSPALLFDTQGADSLSADQVSEGTLLVLGLLAALHAPTRPNLVLLDDLDRGLHPQAQRELSGLLRGVLESNPRLAVHGDDPLAVPARLHGV